MELTFDTWKHPTESGFFTTKQILKMKVWENIWILLKLNYQSKISSLLKIYSALDIPRTSMKTLTIKLLRVTHIVKTYPVYTCQYSDQVVVSSYLDDTFLLGNSVQLCVYCWSLHYSLNIFNISTLSCS